MECVLQGAIRERKGEQDLAEAEIEKTANGGISDSNAERIDLPASVSIGREPAQKLGANLRLLAGVFRS